MVRERSHPTQSRGRARFPAVARRPAAGLLAAGMLGAALVAAAFRVSARVVVSGRSMEPGLRDGDRLLLLRSRRVRPGQAVALKDPRDEDRILVKRVLAVESGMVEVRGDNPPWSTDSRHFGRVPVEQLLGRAVYRYGPPGRSGWLRG